MSSQDTGLPSTDPIPPPAEHQDRTADRRQPTLAPPEVQPTPAPLSPGQRAPQTFNKSRSLSSPLK